MTLFTMFSSLTAWSSVGPTLSLSVVTCGMNDWRGPTGWVLNYDRVVEGGWHPPELTSIHQEPGGRCGLELVSGGALFQAWKALLPRFLTC